MGQLGFSPLGAAFLAALLLPAMCWARSNDPAGHKTVRESPLPRLLERTGQVFVCARLLIFSDTGWRT